MELAVHGATDTASMMAEQAVGSAAGRELLARAACRFVRQGPERHLVRDIGAKVYRMGGPFVLRAIADAAEAFGDEFGRLAHDELMSGFWIA